MKFNNIDEQYSKEFFYKHHYDCADIYIWQGQICISKDYIKIIINTCSDKYITDKLSQTLDDREVYYNVIPEMNIDKLTKRQESE